MPEVSAGTTSSMPLPRFANKDFVPFPLQSVLVATPSPYPSSPESRASTVCVDLDAFASEGSRSCDEYILASPVMIDRVSVSSVDSGDNEQTNMAMELSQFQPLNRPQSLVSISSDLQVVVESPSHYEAPAVPVNISALIESVVHLSHICALSSVQLSPNRVREDYTYDTVDEFPVFQVSPDAAEYLPATSPVTLPVARSLPTLCRRSDWVV